MHFLIHNILAGAASYLGALVWTKAVAHISRLNILPARHARKLSHITTAPFFMLTWPLYSTHPSARLIAASVPLSFALRIMLNPRNDKFALSLARQPTSTHTPTKTEAHSLAAYGLSVAALTAAGWRYEPATYLAVAALCFGDGAADLVGTAVGRPVLPLPRIFTKRKTVPGSTAFIIATALGGVGLLRMAAWMGWIVNRVSWGVVGKIALCSAVVEVLPVEDNVTVPLLAYWVAKAST